MLDEHTNTFRYCLGYVGPDGSYRTIAKTKFYDASAS